MELNKIYQGTCLEVIKTFADESIDCVITSPPYWQLRDYGWSEQWGLEPTYQLYLEHLWSLMDEVYRVLKPQGTVWINIGDTYGGNRKGNDDKKHNHEVGNAVNKNDGVNKCLCLIPHRFAIGCIDMGWIVRNDIIWAKRNAMPESVTDRFSKKHEYFFFMVKQEKYYFDLDGIRDKYQTLEDRPMGIVRNRIFDYDSKLNEMNYGKSTKIQKEDAESYGSPRARQHRESNGKSVFGGKKGDGQDENGIYSGKEWYPREDGKNPGSVADFWDIPTKPSKKEHYAVYNNSLISKPIIAGCPSGGIVLDPFCGTGTTGCAALELNRNFIGIEGNDKFVKIGNEHLEPYVRQGKLFDF